MSVVTRKHSRFGRLGVLGGVLVFIAACGHPAPRQIAPGEINIRKVGRLYTSYTASQKTNLGPADLGILRKYAESLDEKALTNLDLKKEDLASVFVSPRDNEPYGIVPRVPSFGASATGADPKPKGRGKVVEKPPAERPPPPSDPPKPIVYEKNGAGGTHLVVFNNGEMREMSSADFSQVVPNP